MAHPPSEEAVKTRIISHMNDDHQDSLVRYLEHYVHLSSYAARNARLVGVSLSAMVITASGMSHVVSFDPPLKSFSEVRTRVVVMDAETREALGRSEVTIKKFEWPKTLTNRVFAYGGGTLLWVAAGLMSQQFMYQNIYRYIPWAEVYEKYHARQWVSLFLAATHSYEALFLLRPMLKKHSVPTGSLLYWRWMSMNFWIDGFMTLQRFQKAVQVEEERKAKAKH